jgi:signal transduction histidine kinase
MQKTPLQFKISSALKNIIGSDLISDDFIAVFELVKNSYDAHATKVEITFENIYSDNAKIIIKDNGKGMNYDDIINKWLFVAYSAKKEGTEEDSYDYRDKIKVKRAYAGAKGIGRFSCDRLGGELYLETVKDEKNSNVETLLTEWDRFEGNLKEEFVNISVLHETIPESNYDLGHGTILEISKLKSTWGRDKLLDLKDSLARLINPNSINKEDNFEIKLIVEEELLKDQEQKEQNLLKVNHEKSPLDIEQVKYFKIINVPKIKNLVFETLEIKTTKIVSKILDKNKKQIQTSLIEGGKLVYKIIEDNKYDNLQNVECEIYYLNRSAKVNFFKKMGVRSVEYGHIFVYKNGLRIYPYGDRHEDPLRMDNRKSQGHSRYIGTRESMGYIHINEPNDELRETSSRGDGLIKSKPYFELVDWFYDNLKRLEKYIIDITDWGNDLSNEDYIKLDNTGQRDAIEDLVTNLTKTKGLISFEVATEIFEIIDKKQEKSTKNVLTKIKKQLQGDDYDKDAIVDSISKIEKNLDDLKKTTDKASLYGDKNFVKNEELSTTIEKKNEQLAIRDSINSQDIENVTNLHHQVFVVSDTISSILDEMHNMISLGEGINEDELKQFIDELTLENSKVESLSRFGMRAIFEDFNSVKENSLPDFINDYVDKISNHFKNSKVNVVFNQLSKDDFETQFRPLDVSIIIDNMINNAKKHSARELVITTKNIDKSTLQFTFKDNGIGFHSGINEIKEIFKPGFSTTKSTGLGLFHISNILKAYNWDIEVNEKYEDGAEFIITIKK